MYVPKKDYGKCNCSGRKTCINFHNENIAYQKDALIPNEH